MTENHGVGGSIPPLGTIFLNKINKLILPLETGLFRG
jgi:hypothetical protein